MPNPCKEHTFPSDTSALSRSESSHTAESGCISTHLPKPACLWQYQAFSEGLLLSATFRLGKTVSFWSWGSVCRIATTPPKAFPQGMKAKLWNRYDFDVTFMASGLLFMASGLQNSLHWLLEGTVLGRNRTSQVGGRALLLGSNRTWLKLVAGTVLGRNMTWLMLVAGTILCWWKATQLGSSKEPFLF